MHITPAMFTEFCKAAGLEPSFTGYALLQEMINRPPERSSPELRDAAEDALPAHLAEIEEGTDIDIRRFTRALGLAGYKSDQIFVRNLVKASDAIEFFPATKSRLVKRLTGPSDKVNGGKKK